MDIQRDGHYYPAEINEKERTILECLSAWLRDAGSRSRHTARSYKTVAQSFLSWCVGIFEDDDLSILMKVRPTHIKAWLATLEVKKTTRAHRLAVLKSMFRALVSDDLRQDNPAREVRPSRGVKASVEHTQAVPPRVVLDGLSLLGNAPIDIRDRAMFLVMLNHGLRRGEVVELNLKDLDLYSDEPSIFLRGKGEKAVNVLLAEPTSNALKAWLDVRPNADTGKIFVSVRGRPLHGRDVARRVKSVFGQRWAAHGLRARSITDTFLRSGKNAFIAQVFARHANPSTTQTYIDVEKAKEASVYGPKYS